MPLSRISLRMAIGMGLIAMATLAATALMALVSAALYRIEHEAIDGTSDRSS